MRLTILFLLVSFCSFGQASFHALISEGGASYYVAESGSGTGVGSQADPFTSDQFETLLEADNIPQGSKIYFNRGDEFINQFDVGTSNLTFDAYGSGALPVIYGSTYAGGLSWTHDGSNVYYATVATEPYGVATDGIQQQQSETAWIEIKGRSTQLHIEALSSVLDPLDGVEALEGSILVAKEWGFRPCLAVNVTDYTTGSPNGVLTLDAIPNTDATGAAAGMPFKLLNKKSFIDLVGEWAWEDATDRLYIKTSGASPSGTDIRISTLEYGIKLADSVHDIVIKNLMFRHQFLEGVYGFNNDRVSVTDCKFYDQRTNAVSFTGDGTAIKVNDNIFKRQGNNGVHLGGLEDTEVLRNDFSQIGTQAWVSIPRYDYFKSVGCAVHPRWDNTATIYVPRNLRVKYNHIDSVGYVGVVHLGINDTTMYNFTNTYLWKWNDGAAYYASNVYGEIYGGGSDTRDGVIAYNVAINGFGSSYTTEGTSENKFIMGIYLDNNCSTITVDHNHIEDVNNIAMLVNWSSKDHVITNNNFINALSYAVSFRKYNETPSDINKWPLASGHTLTGNIMAARAANAQALLIESLIGETYNPFDDGGTSDNNTFWCPYRGNTVTTDFATTTDMTLAGWQAVFSTDATSVTDLNKRYRPSDAQSLVDILSTYNTSGTPTTLDASAHYYLDGTNSHVTNPSVPAYGGTVVLRDYSPVSTLVVDDTYTGSTVTLASHTPDVGVAWTIQTGAHAINGSGLLTSSTAGYISQTGAGKNAVVETTAQVTGTGAISLHFRYVGTTDRILAQVSTTGNAVTITNDASTIASGTAGKTISTSTFYTIKARLVDGSMAVWVDDVVRLEVFNNATLAASNTGTFVHGIFNPLVGQQTRTRIWDQ